MQAIHGHAVDVKKVRSRQVVLIQVEVPIEQYAAVVAAVDDSKVLVTRSELDAPYGILDSREPEPMADPIEKPKGGPLSKWAGMMCNSAEFRSFLAMSFSRPCNSSTDARHIILDLCGIKSRAELDHSVRAQRIFDDLVRRPWALGGSGENRHISES